MTSVQTSLRGIPMDARNFIPISSLAYPGGINNLNTVTGTLATAAWSGSGSNTGTRYTSSIAGPGAGRLRDMGRTYTSSSRVFRKVQLIVPVSTTNQSTGGVEGRVGTSSSASEDFLTGYIELGWEGGGFPAPVARTL